MEDSRPNAEIKFNLEEQQHMRDLLLSSIPHISPEEEHKFHDVTNEVEQINQKITTLKWVLREEDDL